VCGRSGLDYERRKATAGRQTADKQASLPDLIDAAHRYCADAARRGVDFVTFRRLAEVLGIGAPESSGLRQRFIALEPEHYTPPLWAVRPSAVVQRATA
jgi:hypothetical protein